MFEISVSDAVQMYVDIVSGALPIAAVFGLGNILCNIIISAATGGKLTLSGQGR